jgi:GNAT superfamily N-acetyltransferase
MEIINIPKGDYLISTDISKINISIVHDFLANHSHWSKNIPLEKVKKSVENSLNFGVFHQNNMIGYARIISDFATIAYLGDVFILPPHRGKGLSKWLISVIINHPELQGLRRWILLTSDAHELYRKYGWTMPSKPELYMERFTPNIYS